MMLPTVKYSNKCFILDSSLIKITFYKMKPTDIQFLQPSLNLTGRYYYYLMSFKIERLVSII